MNVYIARTLTDMKKYGQVYDLTLEPEDRVITITFGPEETEWFLVKHVEKINAKCNTLLDDGDVDFFDVEQCRSLIDYLQKIDIESLPPIYSSVLKQLIDCSKKAIGFNTGIEIEM